MQSGSSRGLTPKHARACENCSRAKAKCVPQPEPLQSNQCARCFRLNKECVVPPRAVRKKRSPNAVSNSAQLEQKIESLVTLLSAAQGSGAVRQSDDLPEPPQDRPHVNLLRDFPWGNPVNILNTSGQGSYEASIGSSGKTTHVPSPEAASVVDLVRRQWTNNILNNEGDNTFTPNPEPQTASPENVLRRFRDQYAIHSPCAILPPNITAEELRATRPWLYKIVLVVGSSDNRNYQIEAGKQFGIDIATAMITRGEKSLDMFQSLLIYNSWSYYFSAISPQSQSTATLQLMLALLFDLGLNRAFREDEAGPSEILADVSKKPWSGEGNPREKKRTLDERRAFLYCFFLASVISLCVKKTDGLQSSPYLEYSAQMLQEAAEYEMDIVLVACVRLQIVVESINRNLANRQSSTEERRAVPRAAPIWMHAASLRNELQSILVSLPPNLQNHPLFRMTYHSAEIFLYEPSVHVFSQPSFTSQRIDMLYACLLSAKSLVDVFIAQPLSSFFGMSITNLAQIGHACSTLFKLSVIEEVGWDLVHVRQTVNLTTYFDQLVMNFEQAGGEIDNSQRAPSRESFPTGCARAMRRVKGWYEAKVASDSEAEGQQRPLNFTGIDDMLNGGGFDYLDDSYWQEIMADMSFMQQ